MIAPLKKRYRKKQYQRALSQTDEENTYDLYNVNVLQGMKWSCFDWKEIDEEIINYC